MSDTAVRYSTAIERVRHLIGEDKAARWHAFEQREGQELAWLHDDGGIGTFGGSSGSEDVRCCFWSSPDVVSEWDANARRQQVCATFDDDMVAMRWQDDMLDAWSKNATSGSAGGWMQFKQRGNQWGHVRSRRYRTA